MTICRSKCQALLLAEAQFSVLSQVSLGEDFYAGIGRFWEKNEFSQHLHESISRDQQSRTGILEADAGLERKRSEADLDRSGKYLNNGLSDRHLCLQFRCLGFES